MTPACDPELAHHVAGKRAAKLAHQVGERNGRRAASANQATAAGLLSLSAPDHPAGIATGSFLTAST